MENYGVVYFDSARKPQLATSVTLSRFDWWSGADKQLATRGASNGHTIRAKEAPSVFSMTHVCMARFVVLCMTLVLILTQD